MPRAKTQHITPTGRPSDYSDDLLNLIVKQIQDGKTLREVSEIEGMPTFMTLSNWRRQRPDFFYALKAAEEDANRKARRDMQNAADQLLKGIAILTPAGALENYGAIKAAVDSLDKVAKCKVIEGDAPIADATEDIEDQRRKFNDLHPVTQTKIREALIEDHRLRNGEEEEDEE